MGHLSILRTIDKLNPQSANDILFERAAFVQIGEKDYSFCEKTNPPNYSSSSETEVLR